MTAEEKELFSVGCGLGVMVTLYVWLFADLLF